MVGEKYLKLEEIPFHSNVGEIGHHVRDDLVTSVFGQPEGFTYSLYSVSTVCISGHVLVQALNSNLQSGATVPEHGA